MCVYTYTHIYIYAPGSGSGCGAVLRIMSKRLSSLSIGTCGEKRYEPA